MQLLSAFMSILYHIEQLFRLVLNVEWNQQSQYKFATATCVVCVVNSAIFLWPEKRHRQRSFVYFTSRAFNGLPNDDAMPKLCTSSFREEEPTYFLRNRSRHFKNRMIPSFNSFGPFINYELSFNVGLSFGLYIPGFLVGNWRVLKSNV